jgi:putative transposase
MLVDEQSIFEAVEAQRVVVAQAAARTKAARRMFERTQHLHDACRAGALAGNVDRAEQATSDIAAVPMPTDADRGSVEDWS